MISKRLPMLRTLLFALLFLPATISGAIAQSPGSAVCEGYFARYFQNYSISHGEIFNLFVFVNELVPCDASLDRSYDEHALVGALIDYRTERGDRGAQAFAKLCSKGLHLACIGGAAIDWDESWRRLPADLVSRLEEVLGHDMPIVNTLLGFILVQRSDPLDQNRGMMLLRRASQQGDYNATDYLSLLAEKKGAAALLEQIELTRLAADQGHVPSMLRLAQLQIARDQDYVGAAELYRRAATSTLRGWRDQTAEAQYRLSHLLRNGHPLTPNPIEAQRWLESAAALNHYRARIELGKR